MVIDGEFIVVTTICSPCVAFLHDLIVYRSLLLVIEAEKLATPLAVGDVLVCRNVIAVVEGDYFPSAPERVHSLDSRMARKREERKKMD